MTLVARALLPVAVLNGLQVTALSDAISYTFLLPMKFQLSAAPGCRPPDPTGKKLQSRDVAVASVPPCSFLRAFGSKNGGTEATATVFMKLLG